MELIRPDCAPPGVGWPHNSFYWRMLKERKQENLIPGFIEDAIGDAIALILHEDPDWDWVVNVPDIVGWGLDA
jgi:hypothetical protein